MNKTRIEWADYSWNPIKGLCPEECWYCYARRMYKRFGWDSRINLDKTPIEAYGRIPDGSKVFVCSTMELFHHGGPSAYRSYIFGEIEAHPNLTFIILTKRPERIDRAMPDNVWLGVSLTGAKDSWRMRELANAKAAVRFVSFEPSIGEVPDLLVREFDWLIVGRLTGHGHQYDPRPNDVAALVNQARALNVPVFLKNNLKDIWPGPLIQEFPK